MSTTTLKRFGIVLVVLSFGVMFIAMMPNMFKASQGVDVRGIITGQKSGQYNQVPIYGDTDLEKTTVFDGVLQATVGTDYIPLGLGHHPDHSPLADTEALARVEAINFASPPPNPDLQRYLNTVRCVMMMLGDTPVRFIIWRFTGFSSTGVPMGDVSWFDKLGWQDSYALKSGDTLTNVPKDLRGNSDVSMKEVSCTGANFPDPPALSPQ